MAIGNIYIDLAIKKECVLVCIAMALMFSSSFGGYIPYLTPWEPPLFSSLDKCKKSVECDKVDALEALGKQNPDEPYGVGDEILISCYGRSLEGLVLTLETGLASTILRVSKNSTFSEALGENHVHTVHVTGPQEFISGSECFKWYSIGLYVNLNIRNNQMNLTCCARRNTCLTKHRSYKVENRPLKPVVNLGGEFNPFMSTQYVGDRFVYTCRARLAYLRNMTFAIRNKTSVWAGTYAMDATYSTEITSWRPDVVYLSANPGYDSFWSGNFIDFTIKFTTFIGLHDNTLYCCSDDSRGKILSHESNENLKYCQTTKLYVTAGVQRPSFVFTSRSKPIREFYLCATVIAQCEGIIGSNDGELIIELMSHHFDRTWSLTNQTDYEFPDWLSSLQKEVVYNNTEYGSKVTVRFSFQVNAHTAALKYICTTRSANESRVFSTVYGPFDMKKQSQPPEKNVLRVSSHEWTIECTSYLGKGETQSWKMLSYQGTQYTWFITTNGTIYTNDQLPEWIETKYISGNCCDHCGSTVTSQVSVDLPKAKVGLTLYCYSFFLGEPFESDFSKEELVVSYSLLEGGRTHKYESEGAKMKEFPFFWVSVGFVVLILVGVIVVTSYLRSLVNPSSMDAQRRDNLQLYREFSSQSLGSKNLKVARSLYTMEDFDFESHRNHEAADDRKRRLTIMPQFQA